MDIKNIIFTTAREGRLKLLMELLEHVKKDDVVKLVSTTSHDTTPLVIACRNGHYDVAEYLIEKCGANVNQPASVMFNGEVIERAPPLWCAAAAGHLALVKLLVKNGAHVNATTKTDSTPLRAACFDGQLDIVRFLVAHGADIEIANHHGHTNLMIACYKGHIKIVNFLLALKADVNRKSIKGNTALHDCAEGGFLEVVKVLIKHGAKMNVDSYGVSPLLTAAATGHKHIVDYFISISNLVSRQEYINALELLGATYVDKYRDMIGALEYWKQAMDKRYRCKPVIPKPLPLPVVVDYEFAWEITDSDELDGLLSDLDAMRMQALVIRGRILGPTHPDTSSYIRFRGVAYANSGLFSRCIELWNYALDIKQSMLGPLDPMIESLLFSFNELFSYMICKQSKGQTVLSAQREEFLRVFKKAVFEAKRGRELLDKGSAREHDITCFNKILVTTLHLASLLTLEMPEEDTAQHTALHKTLYELVQIKDNNDRNVLHLAFSERNTVLKIGPKCLSCKFPSSNLIKALLRVGADVSAVDTAGNTVLHLAAMFHPSPDLITILLDAGAHIDTVNKMDSTFESLMRNKRLYGSTILQVCNPVKYVTLTCLAARVVKKVHDINSVPAQLQAFVEMH
ncbi:PREDICTED: protein fem-1 homolog CG6966 isoform X1 [Eufriesea mexicana]|uniref:protein fem-1 homolog CG6966 isoform X1 n=1 Tax=Eufriesea mexicana TaxID=516756 RepID=UPI00083BE470|nr:PREDICTED: protein fem-1 homolog CG6966 isoform X1 [Eufriesea mexicana]